MKLEGIVVCVDYADFLAHTLPANKAHFDRLVVVTAPEDRDTRRLCEYHHVECVATDAFAIDRGEFRKACGINEGLARLALDGWVLHLDADIVLPPTARQLLDQADLDPVMLYGADRHNIRSHAAWSEHLQRPRLQREADVYVHAGAYEVATRFAPASWGGYLPIGFFQLWNPAASGVTRYPADHTDAGRTDMLFAGQWCRAQRGFIPEIVCYHLESEEAAQGTNWGGRRTRPFGPAPARKRRPLHYAPHAAAATSAGVIAVLFPAQLLALYAIALVILLLAAAAIAHHTATTPPSGPKPDAPAVNGYPA